MSRYVQIKNPKTGHYTKVDRQSGTLTHKKSPGPYKNVPIAKRRKRA